LSQLKPKKNLTFNKKSDLRLIDGNKFHRGGPRKLICPRVHTGKGKMGGITFVNPVDKKRGAHGSRKDTVGSHARQERKKKVRGGSWDRISFTQGKNRDQKRITQKKKKQV